MKEKGNIKCTNEDCPIKQYCNTFNKADNDVKKVRCKFFFINGNHIGCDFYEKFLKTY